MHSRDDPAASVLIATRNRCRLLEQLLRSLAAAQAACAAVTEILVVDNGSIDGTAALLAQWTKAAIDRTHLFVPEPGKARALNRALGAARAPLLAFLDDDEQVAPEWLAAVLGFFASHPDYDAAIGRVLPPPDTSDPDVLKRLASYRTIAFADYGDTVRDAELLYGGNMALRRNVFETVGTFDERLGPGAAGGCEDADLARRAQRAGLRIGYAPEMVVYHAIDLERLTPAYFRRFQLRQAISRIEMEPQRAWRRALPRVVESAVGFALWTLLAQPVRRERARGRLLLHADVLRLYWRDRRRARHTA